MVTIDTLVQIRKEKKIKQELVAKRLKINAVTLRRYEKGQREMSLRLANEYAAYLDYELKLMVK